MQHKMKVATEPFNKILSGKKVIESRLFDDKRQRVSIGDQIIFSENDKPQNAVTVEVTALLRYKSFEELFADHDPSLFGGPTREFLLDQIRQFHSKENEEKYGVIGIKFIRIKD